jgi:hypothetical protein
MIHAMAGGSEIPIPPLAPKPSQGESFPFELTHLGPARARIAQLGLLEAKAH